MTGADNWKLTAQSVAKEICKMGNVLATEVETEEAEIRRLADLMHADAPTVKLAASQLLGLQSASDVIRAAWEAGLRAGAAVERRRLDVLRSSIRIEGRASLDPEVTRKRREARSRHSDAHIRERFEACKAVGGTQVDLAAQLDLDVKTLRGHLRRLKLDFPRGRRPKPRAR
jgi:DNA-binding CsgD family transcriptional regulator